MYLALRKASDNDSLAIIVYKKKKYKLDVNKDRLLTK